MRYDLSVWRRNLILEGGLVGRLYRIDSSPLARANRRWRCLARRASIKTRRTKVWGRT